MLKSGKHLTGFLFFISITSFSVKKTPSETTASGKEKSLNNDLCVEEGLTKRSTVQESGYFHFRKVISVEDTYAVSALAKMIPSVK